MKFERAPRSKKRISCDLTIAGARYKGIVLDVSASGMFVQTNVKPDAGTRIQVALTVPGVAEPVLLDAQVARKKAVPAALLTAAQGGVGLAIEKAPKAYLDYIAEVSTTQANYFASQSVDADAGAPPAASRDRAGGASVGCPRATGPDAESAAKHFRIHAVETATGTRNAYLARAESEEAAKAEVLEQLGDDWQVIFVERV